MKFKWDRKYLYWGLTAFAVILGVLLVYLLLTNLSAIFNGIGYFLGAFKAVIYGITLAYLLNPLMKFLESKAFHEVLSDPESIVEHRRLARHYLKMLEKGIFPKADRIYP